MENQSKIARPVCNRIMVVSENDNLTKYIQDEFDVISKILPIQTDYYYTKHCNCVSSMESLGAEKINLRNFSNIISNYDLIISLHCQEIFPVELVSNVRCINIHPGYNPYNKGWYPQVFSIINGKPIGVTIHLMDEYIDNGEIICQEMISINEEDTSLEVYDKLIDLEKSLIKKNLLSLIKSDYRSYKANSDSNYNSRIDYDELKQLNLNHTGSLRDHLNLLRALSHGNYKNGYFIGRNGKKYYVRVIIEKE